MPSTTDRRLISIFYSYAHKDARLQRALHEALRPLEKSKKFRVSGWYDGRIAPGTEWEPAIIEAMHTADIILLLLSPAFVDSKYCYEKELEVALERHNQREARVIPILLRDVSWRDRKFAKLQAVPRERPWEKWRPRAKAQKKIREAIRKHIHDLIDGGPVADAINGSRATTMLSERQLNPASRRKRGVLAEYASVSAFWDARSKLAENDLVAVRGTFSDFAPLVIGYPGAKRRLHYEFRRALERSYSLTRKKRRAVSACLSISAGQMVWRCRPPDARTVNCGLYESIVRNSIPVYVTQDHYRESVRRIMAETREDAFEARVQAWVVKQDNSHFRDYAKKYGLEGYISRATVDEISQSTLGLFINGEHTGIERLGPPRYLDGDIWVAGQSSTRQFFVTTFLNVANATQRDSALRELRKELDAYRGLPTLIGQYDELSDVASPGFSQRAGASALEEIFGFGLGDG